MHTEFIQNFRNKNIQTAPLRKRLYNVHIFMRHCPLRMECEKMYPVYVIQVTVNKKKKYVYTSRSFVICSCFARKFYEIETAKVYISSHNFEGLDPRIKKYVEKPEKE